ncbi:MAG TPA: hypothetical protein VMH91_01420 [Candidatus Paceibacterota bacterium]|nr:hypothetical protein [Candidatus Paceibacterota bacterium]
MQRVSLRTFAFPLALAVAIVSASAAFAYAQTTTDAQLRATIQAEVTADPRSQTMSQAQIQALVDSLTAQAQAQGLTASQLTYRAPTQTPETSLPAPSSQCTTFSCSLARAFGLDGSVPIIPIALFVAAALFILLFSIMRELGHPHAQA